MLKYLLASLSVAHGYIDPKTKKDVKIGVFSDIHLALYNYSPTSDDKWCRPEDKIEHADELTQLSVEDAAADTRYLDLIKYGTPLDTLLQVVNVIWLFVKLGRSDAQASSAALALSGKPNIALLGRRGCDAPEALVDSMMQLMQVDNKKEPIDFIVLNGDNVSHGIALKLKDRGTKEEKEKYSILKDTHKRLQELFTKNFPNTPVFFTFGNNDTKWHYQFPFKEEKEEFFNFMFDLWFKKHTPNRKYANQVEKTFKNGGYYKVDIDDKISVLAINTLMYNQRQYEDQIGQEAEDQFRWLEKNMKSKSQRKYIFITHIYAGARVKNNDQGETEELWRPKHNKRYFDILSANKDKLIIEVGGHDHWESIRSFEDDYADVYRNILVPTAIGMNKYQLPGFNTFKVDAKTLKPKELLQTNVDITQTIGQTKIPAAKDLPRFIIDFEKDYGFKDLTADSIDDRLDQLYLEEDTRPDEALEFLSDKLGFDHTNPDQFEEGLRLAKSWSYVSDQKTRTAYWYCQNTENRNNKEIRECIARFQRMAKAKMAAFQNMNAEEFETFVV